MSATRQLNLNIGFDSAGFFDFAWPFRTGRREDIFDPSYFARLAQVAHRGRFDAVFFTDTPFADSAARRQANAHGRSIDARNDDHGPGAGADADRDGVLDLQPSLQPRAGDADGQSDVSGPACTQHRLDVQPVFCGQLQRRSVAAARRRYARATEFVEILKGLWNSWDERRGVPTDGQFWDQAEARAINYKGAHYTIRSRSTYRNGEPWLSV